MEPERPIEKLLRDAAEKRRGEQVGEFSLSAPARRVLQGEVARVYGRQAAKPARWYQVFAWRRPRIAWAVALLLGVGTVAALLASRMGEHRAEKLALNFRRMEPPATPGLATALPAPTLAAPGETPAQADRLMTDDSAKETLTLGIGSPSRSIQTQQFLAMLDQKSEANVSKYKLAVGNGGQTFEDTANQAVNLPPPAAVPALAPPRPALAGIAPGNAQTAWLVTNAPLTVQGDYSLAGQPPLAVTTTPTEQGRATELASARPAASIASANFSTHQYRSVNAAAEGNRVPSGGVAGSLRQSAAAKAVLTSFRMEKAGQNLRIIDKDGSVYSGHVEIPKSRQASVPESAPAAATAEAESSRVQTHSTPGISNPGYYFFRVTGTNRSLKQHVVFSGNLMTEPGPPGDLTNAFAADGLGGGVPVLKAAPAGRSNGVSRVRITGQAKIGSGEEIEINAVRTNP